MMTEALLDKVDEVMEQKKPEIKNSEASVFEPDNRLRELIGKDIDLKVAFSADVINRCQNMINEEKKTFFKDLEPEFLKLQHIFDDNNLKPSPQLFTFIYNNAFSIKTQADMLGLPFLSFLCLNITKYSGDETKLAPEKRLGILKYLADMLVLANKKQIYDDGKELKDKLIAILAAV